MRYKFLLNRLNQFVTNRINNTDSYVIFQHWRFTFYILLHSFLDSYNIHSQPPTFPVHFALLSNVKENELM